MSSTAAPLSSAFSSPDHEQQSWEKFGLSGDPFSDSFDVYQCHIPQWEETLDSLHHLCRYNNQLIAVTAGIGSGKSTIMQRFVETFDENFATPVQWTANAQLSASRLLTRLAQQLQVSLDITPQSTLQEQLNCLLESLYNRQKRCLLIIDDAHHLPTETLILLSACIRAQAETQKCIHVILFGESELTTRLQNIATDNDLSGIIHDVPLPPMSFDEMEYYLTQRFQAFGWRGNLPYNKAAMRHIFALSGGYPGRVNQVAKQMLLSKPTKKAGSMMGSLNRVWQAGQFRIAAGSLLAVSLLASAYALNTQLRFPSISNMVSTAVSMTTSSAKPTARHAVQKQVIPVTKTTTVAKAVPAVAIHAIKQAAVTTDPTIDVKVKKPVPLTEQIAATAKMISDLLPQPKLETPTATAKTASMTASAPKPQIAEAPLEFVADDLGEPEMPVATRTTTKPTKTTVLAEASDAGVKTSPRVAAKPKPTPSTPNGFTVAEHQVLSWGSDNYTIQLVGAQDVRGIHQFIAEHGLGKETHTIKTLRNGKPWYVLTYGHYTGHSKAKAAIASLPASIKAMHPWVRSVKPLQQAIRQRQQPKVLMA